MPTGWITIVTTQQCTQPAIIQYGEEKYADALATIDRFLAETKSGKADQPAFRAGVLAGLNRNDEAAAIYKDLINKNPPINAC